MDKIFLTFLNMSLTGTYVIAAICLVRLLLKKAPKIISYCLWAIAGFRLVFPFSIESVFSLIPFKAQVIPTDIATQPVPHIDSGIPFVNNTVNSLLPVATPSASINPLQGWITAGTLVWLIGAVVMVMYGVVSFVVLKRKMKEATHVEANIYESRRIKSPFVLGVFRPRIYLPFGLSEKEKAYILLHEQTHIRRHDHIIKIVAYFILCLHWFNPLVWAAFLLMGADMEMSCDERVLKEMGNEVKKDYSLSLLSLATEHRTISGSPLSFGEGGMKERIKNVLKFKKPSRVMIIASLILVAVLGVSLAANRIFNPPLIEMEIIRVDNPASFFKEMRLIWDDAVYHVVPMDNPQRGKQIGYARDENSTWRIYELKGYPHDYLLAVESKNVQRVMSIHPPEKPLKQYILENATEKDKGLRLLSVSLYKDGTARLATPPISSYMLPDCTYTFTDGELLILAVIESEWEEGFFGVKNGEVIARFTVVDDHTLAFKWAGVPLFADEGARYVSLQTNNETKSLELALYPGVPADPKAAKPIAEDEEGRYPLDSVITAVVNCPWEADITLYFAETDPEADPVSVPFPIEKGTDIHMIRIDMDKLFPQGFLGRVWAVARDAEGMEHQSNRLMAVYAGAGQSISGEPRKWFDYYFDEKMPWDGRLELELPEYPGTVFQWTPYEVKAIDSGGEKTLFTGMPIWNVYLADLTGDGLPELCATVSIGSGIIDERILVCDYSTGKIYDLNDRMYYDYALYLDNGRLMVKQTKYPNPQGDVLATGELAIVDGELTAVGIDRTKPETGAGND